MTRLRLAFAAALLLAAILPAAADQCGDRFHWGCHVTGTDGHGHDVIKCWCE